MKQAVFFDLQGTLGDPPLGNITEFSFYDGAVSAVAEASKAGLSPFIITNQSHISRGYLTMETFWAYYQKLEQQLKNAGANVVKAYCCPHLRVEQCICKKPSTYFIDLAKKAFDIDLSRSYVVGDIGRSDMLMAQKAGTKGVLVKTGAGQRSLTQDRASWQDYTPDFVAKDVAEAVWWMIRNHSVKE